MRYISELKVAAPMTSPAFVVLRKVYVCMRPLRCYIFNTFATITNLFLVYFESSMDRVRCSFMVNMKYDIEHSIRYREYR